MISPEELFDKKFEKGRGYDKKEVDEYIQTLNQNYTELYRQNISLEDQIHTLNNALQHYKAIETSLQKALILAEKTADETVQTAELKAESIIREAKNKATGITADSRYELEAVHGKTIALMQEYVNYKAQFNKLIQEELDLLNGSRFEIQTDDLLAFQKLEAENDSDLEDHDNTETNLSNDSVADEESVNENSDTLENAETEEDNSYSSAIPEKPSQVEVFKGYKVPENDSMNQLDYLNSPVQSLDK